MTANQINYQVHKETVRHDLATEQETALHNRTTEQQTSEVNAETARANRARETENERSNRAREQETYRHDFVTEGISAYDSDTRRMTALEQARHQSVEEALGYGQLTELARSHLANEAISAFNASEQQRHFMATELETSEHNRADESLRAQANTNSFIAANAQKTSAEAAKKQADAAKLRALNDSQRLEIDQQNADTNASRAKTDRVRSVNQATQQVSGIIPQLIRAVIER